MDDPQQMTDKRVEDDSGLVPYRRGVSLREVAKGTLARFLPGTLLTLLGAIVLFAIGAGSPRRLTAIVLGQVVSLGQLVMAHTAGFGLGLLGLMAVSMFFAWLTPTPKALRRD